MARPCTRNHYLTEEQKQLASDNLPLVWWYLDKQVLRKGTIQTWEIDECAGHLIWHLCMCAENFDPTMGIKFSTYARNGLRSGLCRYLALRNKHWGREVLTDWIIKGNDGDMSSEPEYIPKTSSGVAWEDVKFLFDIIKMNRMEEQIIFFIYEKRYTLTKVGKVVGMTGERIRQLHNKIVDKLKIAVRKNDIVIEDFIGV